MRWVQVLVATEKVFYSDQGKGQSVLQEVMSSVCLAKENKGWERELLYSTDMSRE